MQIHETKWEPAATGSGLQGVGVGAAKGPGIQGGVQGLTYRFIDLARLSTHLYSRNASITRSSDGKSPETSGGPTTKNKKTKAEIRARNHHVLNLRRSGGVPKEKTATRMFYMEVSP